MSFLTVTVALAPFRPAVGSEASPDLHRKRQAGLAKWVDQWRDSRPATREVADSLNSELIWAPLKPVASPLPVPSPSAVGRAETASEPLPGGEAASTEQSFPGKSGRR